MVAGAKAMVMISKDLWKHVGRTRTLYHNVHVIRICTIQNIIVSIIYSYNFIGKTLIIYKYFMKERLQDGKKKTLLEALLIDCSYMCLKYIYTLMKKLLKRHKGKVFNWLMLEATLWAAVKLLNFSFLESNWKLSHKKSFHLSLPCPPQYFVTHVDVTTQDGLVVRLSFSNLFKEFKSTSTWLQFPFICPAGKGSVERITSKSVQKGMIISFRIFKKTSILLCAFVCFKMPPNNKVNHLWC